jgi:hypothetical protein
MRLEYSSIAPLILNISTGEVSGTFHALTAFYTGKETCYPLNKEAGCTPQSVWILSR